MAQTGGSQSELFAVGRPNAATQNSDWMPHPPLTPETASLPPAIYPPPPPAEKLPRRSALAGGMAHERRVLQALLLLALLVGGLLAHRLWDFGSAISTQGPLTTQTSYMTGSDRVNLLIMGYGGGTHDGPNLTDSMIVVSLNLKDDATTMISVPRDLWVQVPPGSGNYAKLNTAYRGWAGSWLQRHERERGGGRRRGGAQGD